MGSFMLSRICRPDPSVAPPVCAVPFRCMMGSLLALRLVRSPAPRLSLPSLR
jgi:hypothetical protein